MYEYVGIVPNYGFQEPSGFWIAGVELTYNGEQVFEQVKFANQPSEAEVDAIALKMVEYRNLELKAFE